MKERLVELVRKAHDEQKYLTSDKSINAIADYLLDNGVIVPPVRIGNKVYIIAEVSKKVVEATVIGVWMYENNVSIITEYGTIHHNSVGKTVFPTKEEAQAKLKEGGDR